MPCTKCTEKGYGCVFDPCFDRRRRGHLIEISQLNRAFQSTVAQVRRGTPDEIKSLLLKIRSFKTDDEAIEYLTRRNG